MGSRLRGNDGYEFDGDKCPFIPGRTPKRPVPHPAVPAFFVSEGQGILEVDPLAHCRRDEPESMIVRHQRPSKPPSLEGRGWGRVG